RPEQGRVPDPHQPQDPRGPDGIPGPARVLAQPRTHAGDRGFLAAAGAVQDFWRNSGFHLLERDAHGRLSVTDDFLRAYLLRPEIRPVDESGPNEVALHGSLLDDPRREVSGPELQGIEDGDARDNYGILLAFLARLKRAESVEACYLGLFTAGDI